LVVITNLVAVSISGLITKLLILGKEFF
jgi:hypothetical protein